MGGRNVSATAWENEDREGWRECRPGKVQIQLQYNKKILASVQGSGRGRETKKASVCEGRQAACKANCNAKCIPSAAVQEVSQVLCCRCVCVKVVQAWWQ